MKNIYNILEIANRRKKGDWNFGLRDSRNMYMGITFDLLVTKIILGSFVALVSKWLAAI